MRTITLTLALALALAISALATAAPPTPTSVTIAASPQIVVYGGQATLSGMVVPAQANERVSVLSQPCGQSALRLLASPTTAASGAWSTLVTPTVNTAYQARVKRTNSATIAVQVRPRVRLAKVAPRRYRARVFAAESFAGKTAVFQRYAPTLGRWVRVRGVVLAAVGAGTAPTVISGAVFRSGLRSGVRVRLLLPKTQTGACYLGGISNAAVS